MSTKYNMIIKIKFFFRDRILYTCIFLVYYILAYLNTLVAYIYYDDEFQQKKNNNNIIIDVHFDFLRNLILEIISIYLKTKSGKAWSVIPTKKEM